MKERYLLITGYADPTQTNILPFVEELLEDDFWVYKYEDVSWYMFQRDGTWRMIGTGQFLVVDECYEPRVTVVPSTDTDETCVNVVNGLYVTVVDGVDYEPISIEY